MLFDSRNRFFKDFIVDSVYIKRQIMFIKKILKI